MPAPHATTWVCAAAGKIATLSTSNPITNGFFPQNLANSDLKFMRSNLTTALTRISTGISVTFL
jgi:hypothetical protein